MPIFFTTIFMIEGDLKINLHPQDSTTGVFQDSIPSLSAQDTVSLSQEQDTIPETEDTIPARDFSMDEIRNIFEQSSRRDPLADSSEFQQPAPFRPILIDPRADPEARLDSSHIILSVDPATSHALPEFSLKLPRFSYKNQDPASGIFIEEINEKQSVQGTPSISEPAGKPFTGRLIVKEKAEVTNDWLLGVLIVSFVIFAWIRLFYNKFLTPTLVSVFNQQTSYNLFRDKSSLSSRVSYGLNLIFYINTALFIFLALSHKGIGIANWRGFRAFLLFSALLVLIYSAKYIVCSLVGFISLSQSVFSEYLHNVFLYNRNIGLFLFPILIGMVYMSDILLPLFFYTGIFLIVGLYILRLIRGIQIFIRKGVSIFYMILYLCGLEILPILVFFKLFQ
ncbi:MAG: DUF4271 domain-containing protein [Bacteroidales bacterium]|nr:MAG: DUF4271 domain-containing protein [Bacteroidales bacterium]